MNFRLLTQLISSKDLRNGLLGLLTVVGGLGWALFTIWAHRSGNPQLAGWAAAISLVFVVLILIFVVPPLARNASAEASQMNLPFEFTVGGALVLGLMVVVGFAAWNTGNNLLFLVLSFLAGTLVIAFMTGSACLKKLDVKMRFPETIFTGEPTPIIVSLHNRKWFYPTLSVIAEVRGREREQSTMLAEIKEIIPLKWAEKLTRPPIVKHTLDYFVFVPRRGEIENRAEHVFERRGRFLIRDFELSTRFPFGFFRHRRRLAAQAAEIYIFPKVTPIDEELGDLPLEVGKLVANKRGMGQDLLALRDYQPMDDMRRVDWKATARSRRLIVREFSAEDDKRVTVMLDTRMPEPLKKKSLRQRLDDEKKGAKLSAESERFESGVSRAASLLSFFTEEQAEIRLVIDADCGEYGIGRDHLHHCLRRLASIDPGSFDESGQSDFESTVFEIADERDKSHTFIVTTLEAEKLSSEAAQRVILFNF